MKIDILDINIFKDYALVSGVTQSNFDKFSKGFSIFPDEILTLPQVEDYRNLLANQISTEPENLKYQKQIHGDIIRIVDINSSNTEESDGMITNVKGLVLNVTLADCGGILIYDPIKQVVAALHSGWKGTKLNITNKGVNLMRETYGSSPADLLAYLSPCASVNNYEIGEDVAIQFPEEVVEHKNGKLYLDIKKRIKTQLLEAGLPENNIEISPICTIVDSNYHSYRRDKSNSGRMSAFIGLK